MVVVRDENLEKKLHTEQKKKRETYTTVDRPPTHDAAGQLPATTGSAVL